ncbi:hypothetical protein MPSEU_000875200 [Mayamaea pseudoterrestris]|nr:hypothetical protein MPSEU_000875200 [Mayamaea pseudoterrestris]
MPLGLLARDSIAQDLSSMRDENGSLLTMDQSYGNGNRNSSSKRVEQTSGSVQQFQLPWARKKNAASKSDDKKRNNMARLQQEQLEQQQGQANPQQAPPDSSLYTPFYYQDYSYADATAIAATTKTAIPEVIGSSKSQSQQQVYTQSERLSNISDVTTWSSGSNRRSSSSFGLTTHEGKPALWQCCLFPWLVQGNDDEHDAIEWDDEEAERESAREFSNASQAAAAQQSAANAVATVAKDEVEPASNSNNNNNANDDSMSNNSEVLGERLSEKERQAVLARLRLPDHNAPDNNTPPVSSSPPPTATNVIPSLQSSPSMQQQHHPKSLLNGIANLQSSTLNSDASSASSKKPLKSILRRAIVLKQDSHDENASNMTHSMVSSAAASEHLDGSNFETSKAEHSSLTNGGTAATSINTTAAVSSARRRSLFPQYAPTNKSKTNQCSVHFAPMARVVTIPPIMNSQKADIWWTKTDYESFRRTGRMITKAMMEGGSEIWLADSKAAPNNHSHNSLAAAGLSINNKSPTSFKKGDKWWHRFGHSRRGLEHVVSFDEGKQRQQNVRTAIASVVEEQARQARYNRVDPEKLRIVSLNHTNWARDLALAAGESDADAVRSSFAEDRKSREFYLLKMAVKTTDKTMLNGRRLPEFMQSPRKESSQSAGGTMSVSTSGAKLDANTAAQISFRRAQQQHETKSGAGAATDHQEPIRDADKRSSLADRAKGFSTGDDAKMDMGAVMSGLGPIAAQASHAHSVSSASLASENSSLFGSSPTSSVIGAAASRAPIPQTVST